MSYNNVLQQVKKKQISPVYLLYGTESYFIQNIQKEIIKSVLPEEDLENISRYDLEETPIQEVIADAETYPFFGERKLIIASNPIFLKAKPEKLPFEHDLEAVQQYIQHPVDYSVVVFTANYEKIDERKKISKLFKKNGTVAICNPMKEYELSKWIKNLVHQLNISLEPTVSEMLEAEYSGNLDLLQNELTKLALYVGEGGIVTEEIANDLVAHSINSSSLRLADAVIDKDLHKAVMISKDLQKMNEEPIALIGLLAFQFRAILRVKLLKQQGYSQYQMQQKLKIHPYVIKIALKREQHFTMFGLEAIIDKLTEADAVMKQGKMDKELSFELLLYELIHTV